MLSKIHFDTPFSFEKSIHIISDLLTNLLEPHHAIRLAFDKRDWHILAGYNPDMDVLKPSDALLLRRELQAAAFFKRMLLSH